MSSIPGYTLEIFLAWWYRVVVEEVKDGDFNNGMAEMLGTVQPRPRITAKQFAPVVALFEPYREAIENMLDNFDEDNQSWRGYCCFVIDQAPQEVKDQAEAIIKDLAKKETSDANPT